jgi:hypothetical protein
LLLGKLFRPVCWFGALALFALACSSSPALVNDDDPFDDPFFHDGLGSGTSSLDEILREPAPSVGWLAADGAVHQGSRRGQGGGSDGAGEQDDGVLLQAEGGGDDPDAVYGADGGEEDDGVPRRGQKTFYEKAQEATMATMSVLVGAGMAALPFLIGT